MSMKKKILGLALAGALVVPATVCNANPVSVPVPNDGKEVSHTIDVDGTMLSDLGTVDGQLIVKIPTTMGFVIDKKGNVMNQKLSIKNDSAEDLKVSVDNFIESKPGAGIEVLESLPTQGATRNQVELKLSGDKTVNLGKILADGLTTGNQDEELITVAGGANRDVNLTGKAGTGSPTEGHDTGLQEQFKLVFRLKKA